ncbi:MAG: transcription factor S [Halobacteria archaeon]
MEFCGECGSMMYLEGDMFECQSCGAVKIKEDDFDFTTTQEGGREEVTIMEDAEDKGLPQTDEPCPDCGNEQAYWYLQQTRSADESETRFYICTECDHKWRDYD